jgi:hypothetical protein
MHKPEEAIHDHAFLALTKELQDKVFRELIETINHPGHQQEAAGRRAGRWIFSVHPVTFPEVSRAACRIQRLKSSGKSY